MTSFAEVKLASWVQRSGIRPAGATLRQVAKTCIAAGLEEPEDFGQVKLCHVQGFSLIPPAIVEQLTALQATLGQGAETASTDVQWT